MRIGVGLTLAYVLVKLEFILFTRELHRRYRFDGALGCLNSYCAAQAGGAICRGRRPELLTSWSSWLPPRPVWIGFLAKYYNRSTSIAEINRAAYDLGFACLF